MSPQQASTDPVTMEVLAEQPTHVSLLPEPSITVSPSKTTGSDVPELDPDDHRNVSLLHR